MSHYCFNRKKVLITGASSGIGKEFAYQCHAKGAQVILVARRRDKLEEIAADLGGGAKVYVCDISVREELESLCAYVRSQHVDVLINNAGLGSFGYLEEIDVQNEAQIIEVNVCATTMLAQAVIPQLKERGEGGILSVASIAAYQPLPLMATYAASKAFNLIQHMALRAELASFGVRVLTLCPGPTATEFGGVARVPGTMTGGARDSVELVVMSGLRAFEKNKPYVIPGLRAKCASVVSRLLPLNVSTKIVLRMFLPAYKASKF